MRKRRIKEKIKEHIRYKALESVYAISVPNYNTLGIVKKIGYDGFYLELLVCEHEIKESIEFFILFTMDGFSTNRVCVEGISESSIKKNNQCNPWIDLKFVHLKNELASQVIYMITNYTTYRK